MVAGCHCNLLRLSLERVYLGCGHLSAIKLVMETHISMVCFDSAQPISHWFFGKYCVTARCSAADRNSLSRSKRVPCLMSFPPFCWSRSVLEISITVPRSTVFYWLELYCQFFSKSLGLVLTSGTSRVRCHFMLWAQMRWDRKRVKERKRKGRGAIMINWIKGHLKVFDCAGASGDVSVCNLGSGHKKKKASDTNTQAFQNKSQTWVTFRWSAVCFPLLKHITDLCTIKNRSRLSKQRWFCSSDFLLYATS